MKKDYLEPILFLTSSIGLLILSFVLNYQDGNMNLMNQGVHIGSFYACPILTLFKIPCPTCGLSRGFVLISHGGFIEALRYNLGAWFAYALIIFQIPAQIIEIANQKKGKFNKTLRRFNRNLLITTGIVLIVSWVLKLVGIGI